MDSSDSNFETFLCFYLMLFCFLGSKELCPSGRLVPIQVVILRVTMVSIFSISVVKSVSFSVIMYHFNCCLKSWNFYPLICIYICNILPQDCRSCRYLILGPNLNLRRPACLFHLITARHLGFDRAEPRPGAIFMRFVFCHGRPFGISARRTSIRCNIHEKMADS